MAEQIPLELEIGNEGEIIPFMKAGPRSRFKAGIESAQPITHPHQISLDERLREVRTNPIDSKEKSIEAVFIDAQHLCETPISKVLSVDEQTGSKSRLTMSKKLRDVRRFFNEVLDLSNEKLNLIPPVPFSKKSKEEQSNIENLYRTLTSSLIKYDHLDTIKKHSKEIDVASVEKGLNSLPKFQIGNKHMVALEDYLHSSSTLSAMRNVRRSILKDIYTEFKENEFRGQLFQVENEIVYLDYELANNMEQLLEFIKDKDNSLSFAYGLIPLHLDFSNFGSYYESLSKHPELKTIGLTVNAYGHIFLNPDQSVDFFTLKKYDYENLQLGDKIDIFLQMLATANMLSLDSQKFHGETFHTSRVNAHNPYLLDKLKRVRFNCLDVHDNIMTIDLGLSEETITYYTDLLAFYLTTNVVYGKTLENGLQGKAIQEELFQEA